MVAAKIIVVPDEAPAVVEEARLVEFRIVPPEAEGTLVHEWDFGDDTQRVRGRDVTHVYADDGTYLVRVTTKAGLEVIAEATREVRVENVAPHVEPQEDVVLEVGESLSLALRPRIARGPSTTRSPGRTREGPVRWTLEGSFTWTPTEADVGVHEVKVSVSDDDGGTTELLFSIHVVRPWWAADAAAAREASSRSSRWRSSRSSRGAVRRNEGTACDRGPVRSPRSRARSGPVRVRSPGH